MDEAASGVANEAEANEANATEATPEEAAAAEQATGEADVAPDATGAEPETSPDAQPEGAAAPGEAPKATPTPSDYEVIENAPVATPTDGGDEVLGQATTGQPDDKVPIDELAQMENDNTVMIFGTLPLIAVSFLALICIALYFFRRGKNWNELGDAMRLDPEKTGDEKALASGFSTRDMAEMDPTKPSQRLSTVTQQEESDE